MLDYCYNVVPNLRLNDEGTLIGLAPDGELVRPFDSLFEQRVNNRLVARGYTVIPQFDSMGYRIDLVVVGAKTRLAVECDGDFWHGPEQYLADLARERDLRRCGWEFFRIRESAFYVDEHAALSSLWTVLDGLGIKPIGSSPSPAAQPPASDHPAADTVAECAAMPPANDAPHEVSGPVPVTSFSVEADAPAPEASSARGINAISGAQQPPIDRDPLPGRRFGESGPRQFPDLLPYGAFTGWAPPVHNASRKEIELTLLDIVAAEGPVLGTRAHAAYVSASGGRRVGHLIADELDAALTRLQKRGDVVGDDPLGRRQIRLRTYRLPHQPAVLPRELGPRDLEDIPPHELAALLRQASHRVGWSEEALFREALRLLGRVRLTTQVQSTLSEVLSLAHTPEDATPAAEEDFA